MDLSFLAPGEVKTRGSSHLDGKPLLQYKPSASRHDATSEEKEKLRPKTLYKSYQKVYLSNYLSGIRLLCVPVMIGTKIAPAHEKSYSFWDASLQLP